jgi:hypothetical protein
MGENDLTEKGFQIKNIAWSKKKDRLLGRSTSMGVLLPYPIRMGHGPGHHPASQAVGQNIK